MGFTASANVSSRLEPMEPRQIYFPLSEEQTESLSANRYAFSHSNPQDFESYTSNNTIKETTLNGKKEKERQNEQVYLQHMEQLAKWGSELQNREYAKFTRNFYETAMSREAQAVGYAAYTTNSPLNTATYQIRRVS